MHIYTWKKYGILVPILLVAGAFGAGFLLKLVHRAYGRWQSLTMFIPGILLLVVGCALDLKKKANTFCHFRMIIWGGLIFIFGVVILFTG